MENKSALELRRDRISQLRRELRALLNLEGMDKVARLAFADHCGIGYGRITRALNDTIDLDYYEWEGLVAIAKMVCPAIEASALEKRNARPRTPGMPW
jgi:hypothetical protein